LRLKTKDVSVDYPEDQNYQPPNNLASVNVRQRTAESRQLANYYSCYCYYYYNYDDNDDDDDYYYYYCCCCCCCCYYYYYYNYMAPPCSQGAGILLSRLQVAGDVVGRQSPRALSSAQGRRVSLSS